MEFRWVAALTLWTMLSGPILSQPAPPRAAPPPQPVVAKPVPTVNGGAIVPARR